MATQDELIQLLNSDPENFGALHDLALQFYQDANYAGSFAMAERAIASYEKEEHADQSYQPPYFDIKRLHAKLQKNHLDQILGPAFYLLDSQWLPVFKLGRPRELAWIVNSGNLKHIAPALNCVQLRRLRFLSIIFEDSVEEALAQFNGVSMSMLRAINFNFLKMPKMRDFQDFCANCRSELSSIINMSLRMPRIDNQIAMLARNAFHALESLSLTSLDRSGMTAEFCESLADDPLSNHIMRLGLVGTSIGNEGLFAIISSENFASLQALDLHDGILNNGAAKVLAAARNLPHLRTIDLRFNMIDPAGLEILKKASMECITEGQHTRPKGRI
ncbi:MAG: hypothetical protein J6A01_00200 [Proteobacteria bacterium]|nr:hypothetical protein [Pseudomonadota bacterium]